MGNPTAWLKIVYIQNTEGIDIKAMNLLWFKRNSYCKTFVVKWNIEIYPVQNILPL